MGWNGVSVGNTYFKHKSLHKYTRVTRGQDRMEVNGMKEPLLGKKDVWRLVHSERNVTGPFRSPCCTVKSQVGGDL